MKRVGDETDEEEEELGSIKMTETTEERLRRLLKKRTEKTRKDFYLIEKLSFPGYRCENQKSLLLKAIGILENDLKNLRDHVETGGTARRFEVDI